MGFVAQRRLREGEPEGHEKIEHPVDAFRIHQEIIVGKPDRVIGSHQFLFSRNMLMPGGPLSALHLAPVVSVGSISARLIAVITEIEVEAAAGTFQPSTMQ